MSEEGADVVFLNQYDRIWIGTRDGRIYNLSVTRLGGLYLTPANNTAEEAMKRAVEEINER